MKQPHRLCSAVHKSSACLRGSDLVKLLTLHVEVAMEVWRPAAIQQIHSPIGNLLIRVHIAIVVLIAVDELKHGQQSLHKQFIQATSVAYSILKILKHAQLLCNFQKEQAVFFPFPDDYRK